MPKKKKVVQHVDAETEYIRMTMCSSPNVNPWAALCELSKDRNIGEIFCQELSDKSQREILEYLQQELNKPRKEQDE